MCVCVFVSANVQGADTQHIVGWERGNKAKSKPLEESLAIQMCLRNHSWSEVAQKTS